MDADTHGELHAIVALKLSVDGGHTVDIAQTRVHGSHGIVFVGAGVAKVDEKAIAEILRNMPLIALNDLGCCLLICPYHLAQVFGVEFPREFRGADQIAEHDRELAAIGVWNRLFDGRWLGLCGWLRLWQVRLRCCRKVVPTGHTELRVWW